MDIVYLGHASFRLRGRAASLITDPYDSDMVGMRFPNIEADIVTVSHQHKDHNNTEGVKAVKRIITGPGEYEVMGVSIEGIPTFHDNSKGEERGKNTIYVIEMDGLRICHLGDLGHKLSEKQVEDLGTLDVLIIPVGGEFTIGPEEAAEIATSVEPKIVIPMHYQIQGLNHQTFEKLKPVEEFLTDTGLPTEKLEKLTIKKDELGEDEKKIVVLEKR